MTIPTDLGQLFTSVTILLIWSAVLLLVSAGLNRRTVATAKAQAKADTIASTEEDRKQDRKDREALRTMLDSQQKDLENLRGQVGRAQERETKNQEVSKTLVGNQQSLTMLVQEIGTLINVNAKHETQRDLQFRQIVTMLAKPEEHFVGVIETVRTNTEQIASDLQTKLDKALTDLDHGIQEIGTGVQQINSALSILPNLSEGIEAVRVLVTGNASQIKASQESIIAAVGTIPERTSRLFIPIRDVAIDTAATPVPGGLAISERERDRHT